MRKPKVSVVIPAYNQASFLSEAIQSVLDQTYTNFELIVVNDASLDNTTEIVKNFYDPRVKLIAHDKNKGLPAARNTGMRAASGDLIALLDSDDLFLPEKLQSHVNFLSRYSDIGVSYNGRFELDYSASTIRGIWRPPLTVGLTDIAIGFPFSPSDMVLRKEWAFNVNMFDETYVCGGEDTDFPCRLALAGCKFASVDQVLNKRRYHSGRGKKNLLCRLKDVERALTAIFNDPRCPTELKAIQDKAFDHHIMVLTFLAFVQQETGLGHKLIHKLIDTEPSLFVGIPSQLVIFLTVESSNDENMNHEEVLTLIFSQLPPVFSRPVEQYNWAVGRGYLLKGVRNIIWGRQEKGEMYLNQAIESGSKPDEPFIHFFGQ